MFTVALIGPDGAGKTTIGRRLTEVVTHPIQYVYLGINLEASNLMLPTTRLILELKRAGGGRPDISGPPDISKRKPLPKNPAKRALYELKAGVRMVNLVAEEWFRQGVIWKYLRRGNIVVFDRHFFIDYYFHDIQGTHSERPLSSRLHGFLLNRFYPRPDLVICLDAPAAVLFARKGEGSIELIERRRQEYLGMRSLFPNFVTVDVTQAPDQVLQDVAAIIDRFYTTKLHQRSTSLSTARNG